MTGPGLTAPVLSAHGLRHSYGASPVLDGVDLAVHDGEVLGLVGPNGSGKTTALRILHRSLVPEAGQVLLDGRDLAELPGRERARSIAVMAQELSGEVPLTVADVVLLGRIPHSGAFGGTGEADLEIATEALESAGALHLARREFGLLSGGEKQRVMIARALLQKPDILILDEPTNHLDIRHQLEVLATLSRLPATVIVTLHDLALASAHADRVLVLADGRQKQCGPALDVLTPHAIRETFSVEAVIDAHPATGRPRFSFHLDQPISGDY